MTAKLQTVHVRVNDAATGKPTPCRIRFSNPEGDAFPPLGRLAQFATGRNQDVGGNLLVGTRAFAYIDGACEVPLPVGPLEIQISKGPEFKPVNLQTSLTPGKMALRLTLERWTDSRKKGWYSGDIRCHFLTPHAALLEGAAEDLAVVNLLAVPCPVADSYGKIHPSIPNLLAFSGQIPSLEIPDHLVVVNTHNTHPVLGSLGLLNCHRPIYPLHFGGPEGQDNWTLADWCDQCHRKQGLVVWTKTTHESATFTYGEPLADLILGKIDAFEIDSFEDSPLDALPDWYALMNCGLTVPLVGGSGKENNGMALGAMRTYAHLQPGEELTYKNWIEAVRSSRTFVTNGPMLFLSVDGKELGACLNIPSSGRSVSIRVEAGSGVPFDRLELLCNGTVVASVVRNGSSPWTLLETELELTSSCWLAARCLGQHLILHRPANQRVFAHTSAVMVQVEGSPAPFDAVKANSFLHHLESMVQWSQTQARCETPAERERLTEVFLAAKEELTRRGR